MLLLSDQKTSPGRENDKTQDYITIGLVKHHENLDFLNGLTNHMGKSIITKPDCIITRDLLLILTMLGTRTRAVTRKVKDNAISISYFTTTYTVS